MITKTLPELKERFENFCHKWPEFHFIGVRSKEDKPNAFDDIGYLIIGEKIIDYPITTNPGVFWLNQPMNVDGAAVMKADQQCIDCYSLGRHKGVHKAWIQTSPIYFFRDNDRDNKSEEIGKLIFEMIGANVHRASNDHRSLEINKWSAGCQVFADPVHHNQFIYFSEKSGLKKFTYTLLNEW
jgi:hypothetical protein